MQSLKVSPAVWIAARMSCCIIGAFFLAAIGSQIEYMGYSVIFKKHMATDLRYGGAGLGGFLGWLVTGGMVNAIANASRVNKFGSTIENISVKRSLKLLFLGGLTNLYGLYKILTAQNYKLGLYVMFYVLGLGLFLSFLELGKRSREFIER